ncbi:MAG: hypothetical protein ABIS06_10530 [Vicinamibacterales bacterium]
MTLHDGEQLQLDRAGDLGAGNAGMLIFIDGRERPEYVQWTDIEPVDFHRPPAMYPPLGGRQLRLGRDLGPLPRAAPARAG